MLRLTRYYSRQRDNLYIFITGMDEMIDLKLFPPELNLFESGSAWRISSRMAIVSDADKISLDKAEIILGLNGFNRVTLEERLLNRYFIFGDEVELTEYLHK